MGGSCSRKRDEQEVEGVELSPESGRLSRSVSLRWPVRYPSFNHGEGVGSMAGLHPSLLELSVQVLCQVRGAGEAALKEGFFEPYFNLTRILWQVYFVSFEYWYVASMYIVLRLCSTILRWFIVLYAQLRVIEYRLRN
jgi:hypothetical protein